MLRNPEAVSSFPPTWVCNRAYTESAKPASIRAVRLPGLDTPECFDSPYTAHTPQVEHKELPDLLRLTALLWRRCLTFLAIAFGTCSCAIPIPFEGNTTDYMVLGFGIVSVAKDSDTKSVTAIAHDLVGVSLSNPSELQLVIGYDSGTTTRIDDGAKDIRIALERSPYGHLLLDVQSVKFE